MRLLLDTHVLLWWLADDELSAAAVSAIADPANEVAVSAASAWEISIKQQLGKLDAPDDLEAQLQANAFVGLPIAVRHATAAGALPRYHADPFDRMLVAQARLDGYAIVTRDEMFGRYGVHVLAA